MKAMKFPEPGRAEIVDIPVPVPAEGEMLVRVRAAGICASDVAAFTGTHVFRRPPLVTGHEFAGEIIQVGPGIRTRKIGERVAVLGAGTIGMMTLLCVNQTAPSWIAVTDPSRFKREMALRSGGDLAIDPVTTDPVKAILAATDGFGVDVVFLAVAEEPALRQAVDICRRIGRLVVIASFF